MKVSLHSSAAFYGLSGTFNNISVLLGGKQRSRRKTTIFSQV